MVKIRLMRRGGKKSPFYRVVVADARSPRNGRFIEILGHYNPTKEPSIVKLNAERVLYWLGVGAEPTDTARSLFRHEGIMKQHHDGRSGSPVAVPEVAEAEEA